MRTRSSAKAQAQEASDGELEIEVVTYNVLSPPLCSAERFPRCSETAVDPDSRYELVMNDDHIGGAVARRAVICLQEVSMDW